MGKRILIMGVILSALLSGTALADTLYLRNGSVLQGNFLRYEEGQIAFQLTTSGDRDRGRVLRFPIKDILRVTTDRDPDGALSRTTNTPIAKPVANNWDTSPNIDVQLTNDWVNSNIRVVQGQKIRIEAGGQVTLDGRDNSSPAGLGRRDTNAPLPEENDGALVASIGNDLNVPIIMIGRSKEFIADREGILYFTVNHWETNNARGSYQVRVSTERRAGQVATTPGRPYYNSPFACGLPTRFTETEGGGYTGIWTRRGTTSEYDAVWTKGRQQVTAVLTITTQGNRILIKRTSSSDGYLCDYEGTVAADGVSITGNFSCGSGNFTWQATAECR